MFYKMEFLQPSGSFKDRGIGHMIASLIDCANSSPDQPKVTRLICSSGGNAGHAVATVAQRLKMPADIYVPITTLPLMQEKLRARGANVVVGGANWNEADTEARRALAADAGARYIPPFDDPLIWDGNSSIIDELLQEFNPPRLDDVSVCDDVKSASREYSFPDVIVLSVGGGGLLRGVQLGLARHGLSDRVRIVAVETEGAASFAAAKAAGHVVRLAEIKTVASTLGALAVTPAVLEGNVRTDSLVVNDSDAVRACLRFADEQRVLVEPACGAALAAVFSPEHAAVCLQGAKRVAVVVCGGSAVNMELLQGWKAKFNI
jgi:L-serine/L-threonine ammonia-lyase